MSEITIKNWNPQEKQILDSFDIFMDHIVMVNKDKKFMIIGYHYGSCKNRTYEIIIQLDDIKDYIQQVLLLKIGTLSPIIHTTNHDDMIILAEAYINKKESMFYVLCNFSKDEINEITTVYLK